MTLVPREPDPQGPHAQRAASVATSVAAQAAARGTLTEAEWHLLFDAVKHRLREAAHQADGSAAMLHECIDALDWLQQAVNTQRLPDR